MLLARKKVVLLGIESIYGTDPGLTGSAHALLVKNINITPLDGDKVKRDLMTGYLGNQQELIDGYRAMIDFEIEMAGVATAGTAPGYGVAMRACQHSQTLLAAAVTGSAQAGSTGTIMLAAGASSTDNAYAGMPVSITSGTGSGQVGIIASYNGTSKVATMVTPWGTAPAASSGYSILPCAVFRPIEDATESATIYLNIDGRQHTLSGARGTVEGTMNVKGIPVWKFNFTGLFRQVVDAAAPVGVFTAFRKPKMVNATNTRKVVLHGVAASMSAFTLTQGATVVHSSLAGGVEEIIQTDKQTNGSITIQDELIAVKDWFDAVKNSDLDGLWVEHGVAAGERVAISAASVQVSTPAFSELDAKQMSQMALTFVPPAKGLDYAVTIY